MIIYPYNYYNHTLIDKLKVEISKKKLISDSLSKPYNLKTENQFSFTDKYTSKFNIPKSKPYNNAKAWNKLYEFAKKDSVKIIWEMPRDTEFIAFVKELGFHNPQSFQTFILTNIVNTKDFEQKKAADQINSEVDSLQNRITKANNKIVSAKNQLRTAGLVLIISLIVLFLFRYVFLGIKWSMKKLKQSKE